MERSLLPAGPSLQALLGKAQQYQKRCALWVPPMLKNEVANYRDGAEKLLASALKEHRRAQKRAGQQVRPALQQPMTAPVRGFAPVKCVKRSVKPVLRPMAPQRLALQLSNTHAPSGAARPRHLGACPCRCACSAVPPGRRSGCKRA